MPRKKTTKTTVATYVRSEDAGNETTTEPRHDEAAADEVSPPAESAPPSAKTRAPRSRNGKRPTTPATRKTPAAKVAPETAPAATSGEEDTASAPRAKSPVNANGAAKRGRKAKKPAARTAAKAAPESAPVAPSGEDAPGSAKAAKSPARARKATKRSRRAKTATTTADATPDLPDDDVPLPAHGATLGDLAAAFGAHLDAFKSAGTAASYRVELRLALAVLGEDTVLADITPAMVEEFNGHERVIRTRDGLVKAPSGIAKTRRVLRLALEWAAERGILPSAPLPEAVE